MIENEVDRIVRVSNCDWLEDLITAVFISHTKILASLGNNSKRVNLTIPKSSNFIHKCYINSAREMWKNPYLFDESQEIAKKYSAVCTPDFFGYNKNSELQYRGRILEARKLKPVHKGDSELKKAMKF